MCSRMTIQSSDFGVAAPGTVSIVRSTRTVISLSGTEIYHENWRTEVIRGSRMPHHEEPHSRPFANSSSLADLRRTSSLRPPTLAVTSRSGWPSTWNCRGCSAGKARVPLASESAPPRRGTNGRRGMKIGGERKREREKERRDAFSRCALGRREHRVLSRWTSGNLATNDTALINSTGTPTILHFVG